MSDTVKVSLAVLISFIVIMVAAGRWQGSVDTTITSLFEKANNNKEAIDRLRSDAKESDAKLRTDLQKVEDRLNMHLELCNCDASPK